MLRAEVLTWTFGGGPRSASRPFTARAERGGPGSRFVLTVSGLTFEETVLRAK